MTKQNHKGVIYILTNPSFKDYVKIGYAHDIEKRLKQLNRSETIPFAFRVYAIYEVKSELTDMELHKLIDNLNPDLRTIETFDGKMLCLGDQDYGCLFRNISSEFVQAITLFHNPFLEHAP